MNDLLYFAFASIVVQMLPEFCEEAGANVDDVAALGEETTSQHVERLRYLIAVLRCSNIESPEEPDQVRQVVDNERIPVQQWPVVAALRATDA